MTVGAIAPDGSGVSPLPAAPGPIWYPAPDRRTAAEQIRGAFAQRYGREPDGVWAAPGRVNVIGEHLDYNGGRCLAFAIPHRTFVALGRRSDGVMTVHSEQAPGAEARDWSGRIDEVGPGTVPGWAGYVAGVPWALRADGLDVPGFAALIDSQVPLGSGLSSSAALSCSVAVALDGAVGYGLADHDAGRAQLAAACMRAENLIAQAPTGGLDQTASLRCSTGHALLIDCVTFTVEQVPFDLAAAGLELLVTDTRAHHAHAVGGYGSRRTQCEEAAARLGLPFLAQLPADGLDRALDTLAVADPEGVLGRRTRHVVSESARVGQVVGLVRAGDLRSVGPVLDASHASLRDDFEVSCDELDLACAVAGRAGALGSRMIGGGFGGSCIHLVQRDRVEPVAAAIRQAFAAEGMAEPVFLRALPDAPAGRLWDASWPVGRGAR